MTTLVFGHKSPDTDSTGSPIIWAWYLNEIKGVDAAPALLGEPNTEALFMLDHWKLDKPQIIDDVEADQPVVIVDTNNPAELPASINDADITAIIDHHRLGADARQYQRRDADLHPVRHAGIPQPDHNARRHRHRPRAGQGSGCRHR